MPNDLDEDSPARSRLSLLDWTVAVNADVVIKEIREAENLVALAAQDSPSAGLPGRERWSSIPDEVVDVEVMRWSQTFGGEVAALAELGRLLKTAPAGSVSDLNLERGLASARFVVGRLADRLDRIGDAQILTPR